MKNLRRRKKMPDNNEAEHPGQLKMDFSNVPNHGEYKRPMFEEEYLRESREEAQATEEAIGDGYEGIVTPQMREWFFQHEGWFAPDSVVFKEYWENIAKKEIVFGMVEGFKIVLDSKLEPGKIQPVTDKQIGGDHYKNMNITPTEYIEANNIPWSEGNVIKYISRHNAKNGRQDVEKAIHYCELILKGYDEDERLHALTH